ncbi:hypothetical protein PRABACTJOHN_04158 [Parabacteroides johnsonii DSM 18315]|uniref:Uncharacterized protein n=1 Tax=Parabacteroides johnsonii DSM 18315 TaxID=537006 RepID=B7BGG0_9BACT|nr:hypothetical protein PRABACTJOHN_04158 [Parabacteroides johnsonii DSM 18315]
MKKILFLYFFFRDQCHSSLGTTFFFKKYPFQSEIPFVIIHSQGSGIFLKYSPERFRSSERSCRVTAPKS